MTTPEMIPTNEEAILHKINSELEKIGCLGGYRDTPKNYPEYESLNGKKVLMVDNDKIVLEAFIPNLVLATEGGASFFLDEGKKTDELAEIIMNENPDVVLLDYMLEGTFGTEVAKVLQERQFTGKIIGFSSSKDSDSKFLELGAFAVVLKEAGRPSQSIRRVGSCLSAS